MGSPSDKNSPELHSKAHDCRLILGWLPDECAKAADKDTDHGKLRMSVAFWLREFVEALEQSPR